MTGGDVLSAKLIGPLDQPAEFQVLIAHDAGIGRAAGLVFIGKVLNDLGLKLIGFVNEVIRNAELVRDSAGVRYGLGPAAFIFGAGNAVLRPELEGNADNIITLLEQKRGGGGGI